MPQHDWLDKDFYKLLGVSSDVSEKDLTKAYRKLARKYHPDANPNDTAAEDKFKAISEAYDVLGDPERRKEYDDVRRLGPGAFAGAPGSGGGGGGFGFDTSDISDLLGGMFSGGGGRRRTAAPGTGPRRGEDLDAELHLSFDEAVEGVTTSVHLTSDAACSTCRGSGAAPGTTPQTCSRCSGRGVLDDNQGFFSFSQPCDQCGGRGKVVVEPCPSCRGNGVERKPRQVKVRIPAGVKDGQRIRLKGRGTPGRNGGPAGDLYVTVRVARHRLFGRSGENLTLDLPITFAEAALGANVKVPTLEGTTVTLKIPAGTPAGKTFRVRGRGVETSKRTGDLLVTIVVEVPTELTDAERSALETLAGATTTSPREHLGEAMRS
ncbi:MAG: molecular chaperone DnaJ [Actinomycetia bacterium]|nr:molecular chaperone DnaJ [Actinomycetes bacterium]MCP5034510.1 molecular chaperone DnaJ [Actinomycetes bacterium]